MLQNCYRRNPIQEALAYVKYQQDNGICRCGECRDCRERVERAYTLEITRHGGIISR